ncbi:proton channel OTOP1 [Elgaria multicarinata webbii]|uniref:proton channel OTOP1 n=1 Tax=Elgaria multicarinata webbii TaxID=159646 RepID=UPI002FCCC854
MALGGLSLSRLNEHNYLAWSVKMEQYLRREDLWTVVSNPPAQPDEGEQRSIEKALASIILCLEDNQLVHVRGLVSAQECWRNLREIYVRDSAVSKVTLTRKLYRAQLQPNSSVSEHLNMMRQLFADLEERGMIFTECHKVYVVLSSLDDSWDSLVMSLEAMRESELTLRFLTGRLLEEEQKKLEKQTAKPRETPTKQAACEDKERVFAVRRCFRCGSTEHLRKNCPSQTEKQAYSGKKKKTAKPKVSVVKAVENDPKSTWLMDSGSSQHIVNNKGLFKKLHPTNRDYVTLADGKVSVVAGEGPVFIPSLGSKAYRFYADNGEVIISRSAEFQEQCNWERLHGSQVFLPESKNSEKTQLAEEQAARLDSQTFLSPKKEEEEAATSSFVPRRSERSNKGIPPDRFTASEVRVCQVNYEPESFENVLKLSKPEKEKWFEAMDEEMKSMAKYNVFTPTMLPKGEKAVGCGITLFAVITLIMDSFKIGHFIGFSSCLSVTEGIFPVTHAVHTLLQVYFLWCHAKDIIQSFKTLERFGVIHSVFTNLLLWTNGVLTESKHQLNEHKERLITLGFGNISIELDDHAPHCNCTTASLCSIFSQGIYYLYPFNIEYHILTSTMLYVLWKNIGRKVEHLHQQKTPFKFQGKTMGTILGLVVFTTTIAIVVVYLIQIGRSKIRSELALIMFYLYSITVLTLMCAAGIVALLIYRLEQKSLDVSKNPARKLDADLLVGTASGSWLLSWGSILAIICAQSHPAYTWYNLPFSILVIIEKYIQNLFIIESIHREHEKVNDVIKTLRILTVSNGSILSPAPSYKEIYNGTEGIANGELPHMFNGNSCLPESSGSGALDEAKGQATTPVTPSTSDFSLNRKLVVNSKRSILKNIAAFLFLCNLSLWIPPAFGCRPEYDNGLEEMVFGFEPWIIVVNLAMPFSIFYRMHSAASLFEVSCKT